MLPPLSRVPMKDGGSVAPSTPDGTSSTESFFTNLNEITSDPATTFEQKISRILAIGCHYLSLDIRYPSRDRRQHLPNRARAFAGRFTAPGRNLLRFRHVL
ncbi:MAG: hypothetical protein IID05_11890 [Gemmatimonadetes bacterium]|nr:hypothetical protein [Gemmatimonadota bacterium]